jgi:hypothetical protein
MGYSPTGFLVAALAVLLSSVQTAAAPDWQVRKAIQAVVQRMAATDDRAVRDQHGLCGDQLSRHPSTPVQGPSGARPILPVHRHHVHVCCWASPPVLDRLCYAVENGESYQLRGFRRPMVSLCNLTVNSFRAVLQQQEP